MIFHDETYVKICNLNDNNEIEFTEDFIKLTEKLGSERRSFVSQLITHWNPELKNLLDYFGSDDDEEDLYTGIDGDPMDIREDVMDVWDYMEIAGVELSAEWYRDLLRSKLATLALPKKLISEYVMAYSNKNK